MSHSHKLEQVIALIGVSATIRLVRHKGGREISFPLATNLHYLHWLVVEVGMDNAEKLCNQYQGDVLKLPIEVNAILQLRNEAIAEDFRDGATVSQLALKYEIDRKLVQCILDKFRLRGKLPDEPVNDEISPPVEKDGDFELRGQ